MALTRTGRALRLVGNNATMQTYTHAGQDQLSRLVEGI